MNSSHSGEDDNTLLVEEETLNSALPGEDVNTLLAEDVLSSEETIPSGEDDGNALSVADEGLDSQASPCCPKAQQTSQDQPGETSLSGEDTIAEDVLDSAMRPSLSKALIAVASKDLLPGETSPKDVSFDPLFWRALGACQFVSRLELLHL